MARTKVEKRGTDAFHPKDARAIAQAIENLSRRVKCTLAVPKLTYREMLSLIAPPDHVEALLIIREIADMSRFAARSTDRFIITKHLGREVSVEFEVSGEEGTPAMPRDARLQVTAHNRDLLWVLKDCAIDYATVAIEWGNVKALFQYLNKRCRTPAQVRYFWPSILGIMAQDDSLSEIRNTIMQPTLPRQGLPALPLRVREMCKETAATVSMALLLPHLELDAYKVPDVQITFRVDEDYRYTADGIMASAIN